jgi:hypothetical protein
MRCFFPVIDSLILIQTMTTFPSFDDHYRPQLQKHLDQNVVDFMETKVNEAQRINDADEAERLLD